MTDAPEDDADPAVEEILDDLEDLEETAGTSTERKVLRRTRNALAGLSGYRMFGSDDLAQQIVGGFILSGPFVVTEEVWSLAAGMSTLQWFATVFVVVAIGYGTLYGADDERDPETEESFAGLPTRFISLLLVSYLSVAILAFVFDAPATFGASPTVTARAISIGAIFSVVGAATADSVF